MTKKIVVVPVSLTSEVEARSETIGTCALCDMANVSLKESHSIPKFAYKWIKDTASTPYLRSFEDVNCRIQDGPKEHLLCGVCEGKLAVMEKELAEQLFKKIANYRQQASKIKVTDTMRVAVLSVFWRAILTTKGRANSRLDIDNLKLEEFLASAKNQIRNNECKTTIFFTPFYGPPPYYELDKSLTYILERGIGGQEMRFFDDPHRYYVTFKLPFMFFHILGEDWPTDEIERSTKFISGELNIAEIRTIPECLRDLIIHLQSEFEEKKELMNEANRAQIKHDVERNTKDSGSDKSMARSDL